MTCCLYAYLNENATPEQLLQYLQQFPDALRSRIERYRQFTDRQARIAGKMLLLKALQMAGYSYTLHHLQQDQQYRPFIHRDFDFNISHSGRYAVCVFSKAGRVGVDIEEKKPFLLESVAASFRAEEQAIISNSSQPLDDFYQLWTQKEAVLKAEGSGLHIPLQEVGAPHHNRVLLRGREWFVQQIAIAENYVCHAAAANPLPVLHPQQIKLF